MKTLAVLLLIISSNSLTYLRAASNSTDLAFEECFKFSSERYGINLNLLKAIALTESNMNPNAINTKSDDYGLMQINKFWLPILKQYGIFKEDLFDPCTNILAGAWILADSISRYGATWEAVGAYNAGTKDTPEVRSRREYYSRKVYKNYVLLGGTP
jgi:soluble lytic murein transglycosylase-like protein